MHTGVQTNPKRQEIPLELTAVVEHADFSLLKAPGVDYAIHDFEVVLVLDWVGQGGINFDVAVDAAKEVLP
jgi:hypothetical protein